MWNGDEDIQNIEDDQDLATAIANSLRDVPDEAPAPAAPAPAYTPPSILGWLAQSRAFDRSLSNPGERLSPIRTLLEWAGIEEDLIENLFEDVEEFLNEAHTTVLNFEEVMKQDPRALEDKIMAIIERHPNDLKERTENLLQDKASNYAHFNILMELFTLPGSLLPAVEKPVIVSPSAPSSSSASSTHPSVSMPSSASASSSSSSSSTRPNVSMPSSSSSSSNKEYADPSTIEELRARRLSFFQRQKPEPELEAKKAESKPMIEAPKKEAPKRKRAEKEEITFIDEEPKAAKKPRRRRR